MIATAKKKLPIKLSANYCRELVLADIESL